MALVYRRFGGSTHVRIDTFAQLVEAIDIPETQYVAMSAPVSTLIGDDAFFKFLDADDNGRIRVDELQDAVRFTAKHLKNFKAADKGESVLTIADLGADSADLKKAAERVIDAVDVQDKSSINLQQIRDADTVLKKRGTNGDGIVSKAHVPETLQGLHGDIIAPYPETKNRADEVGLSPEHLKKFRDDRDALLAHLEKKAEAFVWGEDSLAMAKSVVGVRDRLDEHFVLCRLVASQPDAAERFRLAAAKIESLVGDRAALEAALAALPIAAPDPAGVVHFGQLFRGKSYEALQAFHATFKSQVTGDTLTESAWEGLKKQADGVLAWQQTFDDSPVAKLADGLKDIKAEDLDALQKLQDDDLAEKPVLDALSSLEKLVLFQAYLLDFANSFMSMPYLYSNERALYERGHAVLAGRRYELSVLVPVEAAHKAFTDKGTTCVIYGKVESKDGAVAYQVALPKTRGWSTELQVGKRGLFYDINNKEYDLVVTNIVRQPVSVIEAALTPFLRIGDFINKKLESFDDGVDAAVEKQTSALSVKIDDTAKGAKATAETAAKPVDPKAAPAPTAAPAAGASAPAPQAQPGGLGNALAMGGLAVAAVGSSVAFIAAQLKALTVTDLLAIVALAFMAVAVPSGFVGWLKLRKRDLGQLLEGSGWALNDRLRLTPGLTKRITIKPPRVKGSSLEFGEAKVPDEDGEESSGFGWKLLAFVAIVLIVLWQVRGPVLRAGCFEGVIPDAVCAAASIEVAPSSPTETAPAPAPEAAPATP